MANKCYVVLYEDGTSEIIEKSWTEVQKISRKAVKGFGNVDEARKFIASGGFGASDVNGDRQSSKITGTGNDCLREEPMKWEGTLRPSEVSIANETPPTASKKNINGDRRLSKNGIVEYEDYVKTWDESLPYAFTDGSYNSTTGVYGCGGYLVVNGEKTLIQASGRNPEMSSMHNVAGEILGCMKALEKAVELGVMKLTVFYDYEGIQRWIDGSWKAKNDNTAYYRDFVRGLMDVGMQIDFVHAKGHSGIDGNEEADKLAKQSVGLE